MNEARAAPRILTNMAFWQSRRWLDAVASIYDLRDGRDPVFLSPAAEALALFRRRARADVVLTMGIRTSMAYGLLCLLAGRAPRQIMTEIFIDTPRGHPGWRLKTALHRVLARRAMGVITNSSAELDSVARRFALPRERLRFVPLNTTIADPHAVGTSEDFILCAGRTLRDYATLLRAASDFGLPLRIVCGRHDLEGLAVPQNVTVLREAPREEYLDLLRRCRVLALPLLPTERATGQVVLLEAMSYGKPVVTTRSPGTVDHVRDGENGLLVETGDAAALAAAVRRLVADRALARNLGDRAVADMREHHTADGHAAAKLAAIRELWLQAGGATAHA